MSLAQRVAYTSSVFFWFFPFARGVFAIAPALYLLFSLKIMDAFLPTDLLAYALPHVLAAMILSNILYGRTRWPLISELYETIQTVHALPAIINVLRSPRSPAFAVTPKGERLEQDFLSQLSIPFYLMLILDVVCLIAGAIRLYVVPEEMGVITLTMALTTFNMVFSMAAIGIMHEKAQRRVAHRIPTSLIHLEATLQFSSAVRTVKIVDLSHTGAGVESDLPLPANETGLLRTPIPAFKGQLADIPVRVVRKKVLGPLDAWKMGLVFEPQTLEQKRAIVALVYGDSDLHQINQRHRQRRIGLSEGLMFLVKTATYYGTENFLFLSRLTYHGIVGYIQRLFLSLI
ncbi:MAG: PilZ domain-containing protein, partial [Halothiobacillaceae bacterium]